MAPTPQISQDPLYALLRQEKIDEFNAKRKAGVSCDMRGLDFRGLDLRRAEFSGLNFQDAYFRGADLRGLDLRSVVSLEGASFSNAKISGTYFPKELSAAEISLSLSQGIRVRYQK